MDASTVLGFRPPKKRQISPLFPEGVRGSSGMAFSHAFIDFGCPPGLEKETTLEFASAFLLSEISMIFELSEGGPGESSAAEAQPP